MADSAAWQMRRSDKVQLWCVGFGLVFMLTIVVSGQSQEAVNATLFERINGITHRLDTIERYLTATIVALISNLIAHIASIRSQQRRRG